MTSGTSLAAAVLTAAILFGSAGAPASAAPAPAEGAPTKLADASQAKPVADTDEDDATCSKSRKRLWVEGEGWIVRRVTICR